MIIVKIMKTTNRKLPIKNAFSTPVIPEEFLPLFKWFYDNKADLIPCYYNNYYRLPELLKFLHEKTLPIYWLFKKFYGLHDETIRDEDYSQDFLLEIEVEDNSEDEYKIYTGFEFNVINYTKEKVINTYISGRHIYDFEYFIEHCNCLRSDEVAIIEEITICNKIISEWKESLLKNKK